MHIEVDLHVQIVQLLHSGYVLYRAVIHVHDMIIL